MKVNLPRQLYCAATVRELDRIAIQDLQISGVELMARAGKAAFDVLMKQWPAPARIAVVCGRGNNAGDGYVLARLAAEQGYDVDLCDVDPLAKPVGDAGKARDEVLGAGLQPISVDETRLAEADVIVDGIFGTGLNRPVEGKWLEAIHLINDSASSVLALDIPSGLNADTGRAMGTAVRASACVSFIGLKRGLLTGQGPDLTGTLYFDDLRVPKSLYTRVAADAYLDNLRGFSGLLGPRPRNAHKGNFGHVLIVGGDQGYAGAARLAAEASLRCGAGLVSLATRIAHAHVINAGRHEIMARGVEDAESLQPLCDLATVIVVGPGLGRHPWGRAMLKVVLDAGKPAVLDADALNLLSEHEPIRLSPESVITPHPGEAGRLLGRNAGEIESDRFASLEALANKYGCVCVLKGAGTLTGTAGEPAHICAHGNPGMASGGMGDVLSGIIGALMAQGADAGSAARAGVCLHAAAADKAARAGERGTLASDLFSELRALVNVL